MLTERLLEQILESALPAGRLTVVDAEGRTHRFGPGGSPEVTIRLHDPGLLRRLLISPALAAGEAYMDGRLSLEQGGLREFQQLASYCAGALQHSRLQVLRRLARRPMRWKQQFNTRARARRNAAHHYDLSGSLYDLFLDRDRQYSCAYFPTGEETLEQAQGLKKRHIEAKLCLAPDLRVLDIGCGWGGLDLEMAARAEVEVTGLTLSREQHETASQRAAKAGLAERAHFHLRDYRDETGRYDRIVSVGMFEHVGTRHYRRFFDTLARLLEDEGIALIHAIGRSDSPWLTDAWTRKYIFPGGYCPALSEVLAAVEPSGLCVTDVEILRLHYAHTLRHWFERFQAHRDRARELYDERFCRMWEFYLSGAEMAFRHGHMMVFQLQLAHRQDAVPLTRDYIHEAERRLSPLAPVAPPVEVGRR